MKYILTIDQGTTSSRAILYDQNQNRVASAQEEFPQYFPESGWVEHNAEEIWDSVVGVCKRAIESVDVKDIASIGITNQRETLVAWDADTGAPVHNAIVWQDRRTSAFCQKLKADGYEAEINRKTGLLLDPYFSATKANWLLENIPAARALADKGKLCLGTIDCFLIWRLTAGNVFATDATNAARTMLFDISEHRWDSDICRLMQVPEHVLPEVKDCAADFGQTDPSLFGTAIPISAVAGDQQAATIGQACFNPGMMKSTYGTGCFALLNTGTKLVQSKNRLLSTIAYRLDGQTTYALEGSIFMAGATVQWLRDGLEIVADARETAQLAMHADSGHHVYMVPAFTGLGAPYWDADSRGAIFGLTRNSGPKEFARAALESVGYQTRDLVEAMMRDWGAETQNILRVDGGMTANDWAMQFLADILNTKVDRPKNLETTSVGVAWLAGMYSGIYPNQNEFASNWAYQTQFAPNMSDEIREQKYAGWQDAVRRTLSTN